MTTILVLVLIVLAVGAAIGFAGLGIYQAVTGVNVLGLPSSATSSGQTVNVLIPAGVGNPNSTLNYSPASVIVAKGGSVIWTNNDPIHHTVTSTSVPSGVSGFDSKDLAQGAKYQVTFSTAGTYKYICAYHSWMQGNVTVTV